MVMERIANPSTGNRCIGSNPIPSAKIGSVAERLKAAVLKTADPQGSESSNLSASANFNKEVFMAITGINLSLSNRCNAKCIWCPTSRGTNQNYDMSFDIVKKVIDEVSETKFPYKIKMIHLSENGEALYNPDFLNIVRYIKSKLPDTALNLLSNFSLLTPEIAKSLLEEKLLSSVQVNIDGHDADSYKAAKGISYNGVIKNVKSFLELRDQIDPNFDFTVNVMVAFEYATTVNAFFGKNPDRATSDIPYSSYEDAVRTLREFVPDNVNISHSKSGFWAERELASKSEHNDYSKLNCPLLNRIKEEVFISPNGNWYPCCLDDNNEMSFGNVNDMTLLEMHNSEKRRVFIQNLIDKKFAENGYPCSTVLACQTITIPKETYSQITQNYTIGSNLHIPILTKG